MSPRLLPLHRLVPAAVPMLHRLGQYVQLGLDGNKVAWMAGIGVVVRRSGAPPVAQGMVRAEIDPALHTVRALVLP